MATKILALSNHNFVPGHPQEIAEVVSTLTPLTASINVLERGELLNLLHWPVMADWLVSQVDTGIASDETAELCRQIRGNAAELREYLLVHLAKLKLGAMSAEAIADVERIVGDATIALGVELGELVDTMFPGASSAYAAVAAE